MWKVLMRKFITKKGKERKYFNEPAKKNLMGSGKFI